MKKTLKKSQGLTLIGFVFVLGMLGFFAFAGMQIGPVYLDHMSVVKAMETAAKESTMNDSPTKIKTRIAKLLDVSYVDQVTAKDFKIIRGSGRQIEVKYVVEKDFVFNLGFIMKFEERVSL